MAFPERLEIPGGRLERWDAERHVAVVEAMRADLDVTAYLEFLLTEDPQGTSARYAQHWEEHGHGLWAVMLDDAGPCGWVGGCHPRWHPEFAQEVELAWGFCRPAWGRGIATLGGRAAAEACFTELGLPSVMAFFDPGNERSIAVGRRLGMTPTGETTEPKSGLRLLTYALTPDQLK